ncbi:olfactory receptor 1361-like [Sarcophilus harrisii]|uniref:olfactory receptor 1361-like n=1 Tax=Sarcophilus harrisii TaxID=9305 RepID=UPI001301C595|nr:olfactory receptor 1361-like [Sarcophilus harrisii]
MYILLINLSLGDLCFTSTTVPRLLYSLFTGDQSINHTACLTQVFFFLMAGNVSSYVLAVMAWDRYVAVCRPLHYATVVTRPRCIMLIGGVWVGTTLHSLLHTVLIARLTFCSSRDIPHFYCDVYPLLQLACSDTSLNYIIALVEGSTDIILPAACIVISYVFIGAAVNGVRATGGLHKALATCGSHLAVVMLFYGTLIIVYIQPLGQTEVQGKSGDLVASIMFSVVAPTLNPYIYGLQNRKIKASLALPNIAMKVTFSAKVLVKSERKPSDLSFFGRLNRSFPVSAQIMVEDGRRKLGFDSWKRARQGKKEGGAKSPLIDGEFRWC